MGTILDNNRPEISQLIGADGARPSSNLDSYKLHSFYSNLPVYRKKYDWNVPKWTKDDIVNLHKFVKSSIVSILSDKIELKYSKLPFSDSQKLLKLLTKLDSRDLYIIYLNFDFTLLSASLIKLIRSDSFDEFLKNISNLHDNNSNMYDVYSKTQKIYNNFKEIYLPNKPMFQNVDLSVFWDDVASEMNSKRKGTMSYKISTDCCVKFIHSTKDGVLITEVSEDEFARIEEFLLKNKANPTKNCIVNCVNLGVTVYQYIKVVLHQGKTSKWDASEDAVLLESVSSDLYDNAYSSGIGSSTSNYGISWKEISRNIPGKNAEQCRLRYRQIKKNKISDSPFLIKEMARLKILKASFGNNWSKISNLMPGRSPRQCRDKISETTKFTIENALESLQYFRDFLLTFTNYYSNLNKPFFVGRYWKSFDWLGLYLIMVLKITRNQDLLDILKKFYFSNAIEKRIKIVFEDGLSKNVTECSGSDIYAITNFLQIIASRVDEVHFDKVVRVNKALSKQLFRRCGTGESVDFKIFDKENNFDDLKSSVFNSLNRLWP
ncbi:uncharacterized protein TOT_020000869 [Theileria orientalis strain Shintoku]|uniref:Myb-like domain-containing protein n=1 Tax=Theileria orientalis strain Shintoku TaxID=869250 RepID=J4DPF5_THEOR|nr:uncharacterized protein TOT_020000869 [Theileria orientalis strain Shintoku]PVC52103.1 hypothetical protein MACL_00001019 [Theileria orientalis]BAM40614.1 uncharacterized protein TOT_020000869 [Theileria orientalis strain Shintoku]|eukprot:XP_009690915.1 uncharacterized protein TOT_020000869 [Theileria orientalis strain Shintoku]